MASTQFKLTDGSHGKFPWLLFRKKGERISKGPFETIPDVMDAKRFAEALQLSRARFASLEKYASKSHSVVVEKMLPARAVRLSTSSVMVSASFLWRP